MGFFSFLRKISNKEKGVVIYEKQWFSLLEKVSAFDEVRQWAESNGGAYYPLLECRRLTDSENVRKSEDIRKRLVRTVLIFTESSDQLSRATDRVPGLPASPGYVQ